MNENLTRNLQDNGSFEQRVLAELTAIGSRLGNVENRLESFDARLSTMETRFTALEEQVDARLRETRPIWENVQQRLKEIESALSLLNRQFRTLINDSFNLRSRVDKLEDNQSVA